MYYLEAISWPLSSLAPNATATDKTGASTLTPKAVTPLLKSSIQGHAPHGLSASPQQRSGESDYTHNK
jgi:hypothetical protein